MDRQPTVVGGFHNELRNDLTSFLREQFNRFPSDDLIKIDLHCHDYNSDVPDELLGRILNVPETWIKTESLIKELKKNECDVFTITNHNNARSCFEQIKKGRDILTGAEYSCYVPDFDIGIHVLAYGFNEEQEILLNKSRKNIYRFQEYACKENIPTIWAHPLYHYTSNGIPPMDFFQKMALIFERFEVINGQRDSWQNMLVISWLNTITAETIDRDALRFNIDPHRYCKNPYKKVLAGGSDSHNGLFAGLTGSYLYVPKLLEKKKKQRLTELALQAIREGNIVPFGSQNNSEKLTIALLDYVFQIAMFRKDPGLLRIMLHKGTTIDKAIALFASNAFAEIQRHKTTMRFIMLFHDCFMGKVPTFTKKWLVPKDYKPIFHDAISMAETNRDHRPDIINVYKNAIISINEKLNHLLYSRLHEKLDKYAKEDTLAKLDLNSLLESIEIPSEIRTLIKPDRKKKSKKISGFDLPKFLDGLSFPFLASSLILAANYTSARVLYKTRPLLSEFSKITGKYKHPERMLWLTDTFNDNNGVSLVLQSVLKEIQRRNLPIDILVCSNTVTPEDHLLVIKPELEFTFPFYQQQALRIPNFLSIHQLFQDGEYDRVMCSTEGTMGLAGIYLRNAFSVKAYFYIHTDWVMFARKVLQIDTHNLNRFRRLLRAYYGFFDSLFVLNTDQQKWLTGDHMNFDPDKVHLTAHWTEQQFTPQSDDRLDLFGLDSSRFIILYSGRLSREKGVMELPALFAQLVSEFPEIQIVIAGTGPAEEELKLQFHDATYLGWIDHEKLPSIYSSADILILPSKFDTFSCAVLESISCGLPVIAYNTKGPKDIIQDGENGYLVNNLNEMRERLSTYIRNPELQSQFRKNALTRALDYQKDQIMNDLLKHVELNSSLNG